MSLADCSSGYRPSEISLPTAAFTDCAFFVRTASAAAAVADLTRVAILGWGTVRLVAAECPQILYA